MHIVLFLLELKVFLKCVFYGNIIWIVLGYSLWLVWFPVFEPTALSLGICIGETGVRCRSWTLHSGTLMWDVRIFTTRLDIYAPHLFSMYIFLILWGRSLASGVLISKACLTLAFCRGTAVCLLIMLWDGTWFLRALFLESSQLGFGVLELSQSQDVEELNVTCEVDREKLQSVTTNSAPTRLSDVDANTGMKHVFWYLELCFCVVLELIFLQ